MATIAVSTSVQSGGTVTPGPSAASLRPAKRTFSLTGALGTTIVKGDVVAIWGSNDNGATYQPLRTAQNEVVQLSYYNPEVVIDDACDHYATQRLAVGAGSALAAVGFNGEGVYVNPSPAWVQGGNSGFAPLGILGTTDAVPFRLIAEGVDLFDSDGTTTALGNTEALKAGSSLQLFSGSGDGLWLVDSTGNLDFTTTLGTMHLVGGGGVTISSGTLISMQPAIGGSVELLPRAGAGNTCLLAFFELAANGANFVGLKSPDALAASTTYTLPNAGATIAGQVLSSDAASAGAQTLSWSGGTVNVLAVNTSGQSIADGAAAAMVINWTEITDSAAAFNAATGAFIAPVAGFYLVEAQIEFSAIAAVIDAEFTAQITLNGSAISVGAAICPVAALNQKRIARASIGIQLAALDQIDLRATQNSGSGANTLTNVSARNTLTISRIG